MLKIRKQRQDLTGQRFGRLVALREFKKEGTRQYYWVCKCDCGKEKAVGTYELSGKTTVSCGCFRDEQLSKRRLTHGYTRKGNVVRLFTIWTAMLKRCNTHAKTKDTKNYGDRGITVCKEWLVYENFADWSIINGYSDELSIDRIDNDGNYEPNNCRWTTNKEQSRNRRSNRLITINGTTKCLIEWCEDYDIGYYTVRDRLDTGWGKLEAFETRPHQKRKK